jgi:transposase InsO family protein
MRTLNQIEIAWKLHLQGAKPPQIAEVVSVHRATVYRWIAGIKRSGCLRTFLKKYANAKKRTRQIRIHPDAARLIELRRKERPGICGQKIAWWLEKYHGIRVSVSSVYRVLRRLGFRLSSKWVQWTKRPELPRATKPREVIQVDKIDLGFLWVHNFIDCFTREVISVAVPDQTSKSSLQAGRIAQAYFGPITWLQSDNGSEYKAHFEQLKDWYTNRRRITPGKKEENGFVESFNRTLRKECVGWGHYLPEHQEALQERITTFLLEYHTERPHLSLNMHTPLEIYHSHLT